VIALGLALILIVAAATVFAVVASGTTSTAIELTAFNVTISPTPLALFIAGALSVALLGLGAALISRGTRRTARKHKELKQLRQENAIASTKAASERDVASPAERSAGTSANKPAESTGAGTSTSTDSSTIKGSGSNASKDNEAGSGSVSGSSTGKSATDPADQGPTS
jgi:uncharacterized protein HemX